MNGVEQLDHSQSTSLAGEFMTQMKQCLWLAWQKTIKKVFFHYQLLLWY